MDTAKTAMRSPLQIMQNRRILVIDSDARYRDGLLEVLKKVGAQGYGADSYQVALSMLNDLALRGQVPELCLLCLSLDAGQGLSLIKRLRSHRVFRRFKILLHTRPGKESYQKKAELLKIDAFVERPVKTNVLVRRMAALLDGYECDAAAIKMALEEHIAKRAAGEIEKADFGREFADLPDDKRYALRLNWYRCPFDKTIFSAPRLISRALKPVDDDVLALGLYCDAGEKDFLHYPLIEQICCPTCLYTADGNGFSQVDVAGKISGLHAAEMIPADKWKDVFFEVNTSIAEAMMSSLPERQEVAVMASREGCGLFSINDELADCPRSIEDALVANQLAIDSHESIISFTEEESQARAQQKRGGFLLKRANIYKIAAKLAAREERSEYLQLRRGALTQAMAVLDGINDIEFRVVAERSICLSRRFFVADTLAQLEADEDAREGFAMTRKKSFAALKVFLVDQRQRAGRGSKEVSTIERYLAPMEDRINEITKEEKAVKNG